MGQIKTLNLPFKIAGTDLKINRVYIVSPKKQNHLSLLISLDKECVHIQKDGTIIHSSKEFYEKHYDVFAEVTKKVVITVQK